MVATKKGSVINIKISIIKTSAHFLHDRDGASNLSGIPTELVDEMCRLSRACDCEMKEQVHLGKLRGGT